MKTNETNPFNITREEILDLAASKIADQYQSEDSISERIEKLIHQRVDDAVGAGLIEKVDAFLLSEMEKLVSKEFVPRTLWGDEAGKPTTIRDTLQAQAVEFWTTKVNGEGKKDGGYYGKPRYEWLFGRLVAEEFTAAIKQNAVNIIGALKDSIREKEKATVDSLLNELIKVTSDGDKKARGY